MIPVVSNTTPSETRTGLGNGYQIGDLSIKERLVCHQSVGCGPSIGYSKSPCICLRFIVFSYVNARSALYIHQQLPGQFLAVSNYLPQAPSG